MDIKTLAHYIINNFSASSTDAITPLKLQKLLYFLHAWGLVSDNLIAEQIFYKWKFGPVNKDIYAEFKVYGSGKIPANPDISIKLSSNEKIFTDFVISNYVKYSALTLSALTHEDQPWIETQDNDIIPDQVIKNYYSKLAFKNNFPVEDNKPFYPVETDMHYAFVLDIHNPITQPYKSYKDYIELEQQSEKLFVEKFEHLYAV